MNAALPFKHFNAFEPIDAALPAVVAVFATVSAVFVAVFATFAVSIYKVKNAY